MAAHSVQRPSLTAPHRLITTMDTWVHTHTHSHWLWPKTLLSISTALCVCVCLSGQEPFKRRPIFSHFHHVAVSVGDTLFQIGQIILEIEHRSNQICGTLWCQTPRNAQIGNQLLLNWKKIYAMIQKNVQIRGNICDFYSPECGYAMNTLMK